MQDDASNNRSSRPDGLTSLDPTVPWGDPTDAIPLYSGPMSLVRSGVRTAQRDGSIVFVMRSGSSLNWHVDLDGVDYDEWRGWCYQGDNHDVILEVADPKGNSLELSTFVSGNGRGLIRPSSPGSQYMSAIRATAFSLPRLFGGQTIVQRTGDGEWRAWGGRHAFEADDWRIVLEARPELDESLTEAKRERLFIGTHVVQIERTLGGLITEAEAGDVLTAATYALSFAVGRWVGLIQPSGLSRSGDVVWSRWAPVHTEAPHRGSTRWWNEQRSEDLGLLMSLLLPRWLATADRQPLSFLISSALAAGEGVFVEQRLLTTMAALEHYWWAFARGRGVSLGPELTGCDGNAALQLRGILQAASVPLEIAAHQVELSAYAHEHQLLDIAHVLTYVRNRLTHPKKTEQLYERPGLVAESARLARRCLDLALLWELGYQGHICDGTRLNRWAGESAPAPWAEV